MKVLLVNALYYPDEFGGAERVVKRLADSLRSAGLHPEIACLAPDGRAGTSDVGGIPVHRVRLRNVYPMFPVERRLAAFKPVWHAIDSANPVMAGELEALIDRVSPDIVHTHNVTGFSPLIWRTIARRGIPIVHTLHDHYLLCARATMYVDGYNCASRHPVCAAYSLVRLSHSTRVDAVVGVSHYILDRHSDYGAFPNASFRRVIRNPVPVASDSIAAEPAAAQLRIGFLGRLDQPKGLDVLIAACEGLASSRWTLDIGGGGVPQYERDIRARATSPNIRFRGRVDATNFLGSIDVLVVPSLLNDSLPLVIIEAFAAGVPVIGTRMGGIPEVIDEGRTGFLVPANDVDALRSTLVRLADSPAIARSLRPACLAAARQYATDAIAREYADLYRAVSARATPRRR